MKFGDFIRNSCKEPNCELILQDLASSPLTILHTDNTGFRQLFSLERERLSDYLLFYDGRNLIVVILELKGGRADVSVAHQQIKHGAEVAEQIVVSQHVATFLPLLTCHHISSVEIRALRNSKVSFRGKHSPIILAKCGSSLKEILEKYH